MWMGCCGLISRGAAVVATLLSVINSVEFKFICKDNNNCVGKL